MEITSNHELRRAVLIGAPVGGLQGTSHDVGLMRRELEAWGFECIECVGPDATRDGILRALRGLIAWAAASGGSVVIFYSGHGGRCREATPPGKVPKPAWSYLVPVDHRFGSCFRGIAELELACILDELWVHTKNVTVILDCCHSATMVRASERVRALPELEVLPSDLEDAVRELLERPRDLDPDGHRGVVRVVATGSGSPAFELERGDTSSGYLTTELCAALAEARLVPQPWEVIVGQVRERIMARRGSSTQRPEVEGPRRRLPFSLDEPVHAGDRSLAVLGADGVLWMRTGRLHGLSLGDRVQIENWPTGVFNGTIARLCDDSAQLDLDPDDRSLPVRLGSTITPRRLASYRSVRVDPHAWRVAGLVDGIERSLRLAMTEDGRSGDYAVELHAGALHVSGPSWLRRMPRPSTEHEVAALVADLEGLARTQILLALLESSPGLRGGTSPLPWEAEVFVTEPGGTSPRSLVPDETLQEHTRLYVELRHATRAKPTLYINVLERGVAGRLTLINQSEPAGVQLNAEETRWVGRRPHGESLGMALCWPDCVPRNAVGHEELIFVASRRPLDLRPLLEGMQPQRGSGGALRGGPPAAELGTPLPWIVARVGFSLK